MIKTKENTFANGAQVLYTTREGNVFKDIKDFKNSKIEFSKFEKIIVNIEFIAHEMMEEFSKHEEFSVYSYDNPDIHEDYEYYGVISHLDVLCIIGSKEYLDYPLLKNKEELNELKAYLNSLKSQYPGDKLWFNIKIFEDDDYEFVNSSADIEELFKNMVPFIEKTTDKIVINVSVNNKNLKKIRFKPIF